jgi:hypothetical protein
MRSEEFWNLKTADWEPTSDAIQKQNLMSHQHALGNHRPESTELTKADNGDAHM